MLKVTVDDHAVTAHLTALPEQIQSRLITTMYVLVEKLRSHIVEDKLLGQVLNRVTGALGQSIQQRVEINGHAITGIVYSAGNLAYAPIHEYGLTVQRYMTEAWGKPVKNPRDITVHYPERSFMRSSLADLKDEITSQISLAVGEGLKP